MDNLWVVSGLLISPTVYIVVTLLNRSARTEADFEFGNRSLNPSQVLDSSITYTLQVAAIFLFSTWGYQYGFFALIVPVFWVAGYLLLACVLTNRFLERFALDSRFRTLHRFIADDGRARTLRITAALATLTALAGPAMYEAFTVGRTVAQSGPPFGPATATGVALAFLSMSAIYMLWGGFAGVVRLDRWQLLMGLGGFSVAFCIALAALSSRIGGANALCLSLACSAVAAVMAVAKVVYDVQTLRYLNDSGTAKVFPDYIGLSGVFVSLASFLVTAFVIGLTQHVSISLSALGSLLANNYTPGFSLLAIVSLGIANALFQFVDITQWQRLLSIQTTTANIKRTVQLLRGNIIYGGTCGSLTWVLAVLFGIFFRYLFPGNSADPYSLIPRLLTLMNGEGALVGGLFAFALVGGLVSIMSSTVDAMISATAFTVRSDLIGNGKHGRASATKSRVAILVVIGLQLLLYSGVSQSAAGHVDAVLYVCYSFQIALLPSVLSLLMSRSGSATARVLSIIFGCFGALYPLLTGDPERAYELSPLLSLAGSSLSYLALGGFWSRAREADVEQLDAKRPTI